MEKGSSPLARGTLRPRRQPGVLLGLIPARAGNTRRVLAQKKPPRAHPRSRGEHGNILEPAVADWGSSPLARGTPGLPRDCNISYGLIPARAGNTRYPATRLHRKGAHPRSRGEHYLANHPGTGEKGSSPLARGTRAGGRNRNRIVGLIPARAGNTHLVRPL